MKRSAPNVSVPIREEATGDVAEAPRAEEPAASSLAKTIRNDTPLAVKQKAEEWATLCSRDLGAAVLEALSLTLELAGLPGALSVADLEAEPQVFLQRLPEWVRAQGLDPTMYPLSPRVSQGRRSVANFEKFWAFGLAVQNGAALLDSQLVASLSRWLLMLPNATIRSVRHSATVAALAVVEALGHQTQVLTRSHDTLSRQLETSRGTVNARQEAQLKRDVAASAAHKRDMEIARNQLLETTVPQRSRDVNEVIRLYTLNEVERLMKQDPELYLQNKWTARVFLMLHDQAVDVRLKAINVIAQWYSPTAKRSAAVQEHLGQFAQRALTHLVERVADIDAKVAAAALRCLKVPALAERMKDEEFDMVVNMVIGSREDLVREEAALFINSHVFQDPGICQKEKPKKRGAAADAGRDEDRPEGEDDEAWGGGGGDSLKDLYNSETAVSMLVEYLENYMGDKLRITERVVGAFWPRAPALTHWSTMVNLALVGESQRGQGFDPVSPKQRQALLYIMEAAVRRADDEVKNARPSEKDSTALRMNEACSHIIPEMPRLLEVCRPEEQQTLLLSHICKLLVEYASDNSQFQVLVNAKALCQALRKAMEGQSPLDTIKYCCDSLLALARCFGEAKTTFLDLARSIHQDCAELLKPENVERLEELRPVATRFMMLSNRGIDMSFGSVEMMDRMLDLLNKRVEWMAEKKAAALEAQARGETMKDEDVPEATSRGPEPDGSTGAQRKRRRKGARPEAVPDMRLTLLLLECLGTSVMWHARMSFWVETQGSASPDEKDAAEKEVSELLQGFGELPTLRAALPRAVAKFRAICCRLIETDQSQYVQFHAYFAYMFVLQLALGVSDRLGLEVDETGSVVRPTGWGATFEVRVPKAHMEVLWTYLNGHYVNICDVEAEGVTFNGEGHRIEGKGVGVMPAPSQGTMTSVRFLTQQCMAHPGEDPEASGMLTLSRTDELMLAVLASRAVFESDIEDIGAGPLGLLLLTQLERAKPKPLREVAHILLRKLREHSKISEELAIQYFAMQKEAVESVYRCSGSEAALSLSLSFCRTWGVRGLPWLERPLYVILKEAVVECITRDRARLPLLEAFMPWVKGDFVPDSRCKDIEDALLRRCESVGIEGEITMHVNRMLHKLRKSAPEPAAEVSKTVEDEEVEITAVSQGSASPGLREQALTCKKCGAINLPDSNFCRNCGAKLEAQPHASPSSGSGQTKMWKVSEDAKARALAWVATLKTDPEQGRAV